MARIAIAEAHGHPQEVRPPPQVMGHPAGGRLKAVDQPFPGPRCPIIEELADFLGGRDAAKDRKKGPAKEDFIAHQRPRLEAPAGEVSLDQAVESGRSRGQIDR